MTDKIRVLVADDHPVFREGLVGILEKEEDFEVVGQAGNGLEAVELAQQLLPDVAVVDMSMPELNGIEVIKRVKVSSPDTAILVLSAFGYDSYVLGAIEAGASGYLLKSVRVRDLVRAIRSLHAGEAVLGPTATRKLFGRLSSGAGTGTHLARVLLPREIEVLRMAARGLSNKEIAQALGISIRTCQTHIANIFTKLQVGSRTEAVLRALREGWLTLDDLP